MIVRVELVDENGYGRSIAFRNMGDEEWSDPHGGKFTAEDQTVLDQSASGGGSPDLVLGAPGPYRRNYSAVVLVARFGLGLGRT